MRVSRSIILGLLALSLSMPSVAEGSLISVTVDTSGLMTMPGSTMGPFALYFQLTDGSGLGNQSNIVTLSDFTFGGGTFTGDATVFGGASGGLGSTISLSDTEFFNSFSQGFTPGTTLSFLLETSTEVEPGGTPDALAFSILDWMGSPIATTDPTLADTLLTLNIDSKTPAFQLYGSDLNRTVIAIGPPDVTEVPDPTPVPEPSTFTLLALGSAVVATRARRRRYRAQ